jgi:hypothetical protein
VLAHESRQAPSSVKQTRYAQWAFCIAFYRIDDLRKVEKDRDHAVRRRLGFVGYLLDMARSQAGQAPPMCFAAILSLHDAAENFLALACELHDAGRRDTSFLQYFNDLSQKKGIVLTQKRAMGRLNDARVALKHHGTWPSQESVREFVVLTELFLRENCNRAFGFEFDDIDLVDFVVLDQAREHLTEGYVHAKNGELEDAVRHAAIALEFGVRAFADFSRAFGGKFHARPGTSLNGSEDYYVAELARIVEQLDRRVTSMERGIAFLASGVDPVRLQRFQGLAPSVQITMSGEPRSSLVIFGSKERKLSSEDVDFCLSFATEACIELERKRGL